MWLIHWKKKKKVLYESLKYIFYKIFLGTELCITSSFHKYPTAGQWKAYTASLYLQIKGLSSLSVWYCVYHPFSWDTRPLHHLSPHYNTAMCHFTGHSCTDRLWIDGSTAEVAGCCCPGKYLNCGTWDLGSVIKTRLKAEYPYAACFIGDSSKAKPNWSLEIDKGKNGF